MHSRRFSRALPIFAVLYACGGEASEPESPSSDITIDNYNENSTSGDGSAAEDTPNNAPEDAAADGPNPSVSPLVAISNLGSGVQIYPGGGYRYGPAFIVNDDASIDMWTCSPGDIGAPTNWDYIRHASSTNGGSTWINEVVALTATAGTRDAFSVCDPGVFKYGKYYYVGYTSTEDSRGTANNVFLARSVNPTGPFEKWSGTAWGNAPQPIATYAGPADKYGIGEPSFVVMGKKLFFYYTQTDAMNRTMVATVDDVSADDWPAHIKFEGAAITRHDAEDSTDIKYVDSIGMFVGIATYARFTANSSIAVYTSADGIHFQSGVFNGARVKESAHNAGISGNALGHISAGMKTFIAYAYQPPGFQWANWPTYLDPISIGSAPAGTPVAGIVSSLIAGPSAWDFSAPRAWDGDPTTIYSSALHPDGSGGETIRIDLGAAYNIASVNVTPRSGALGFPIDFAFQSSVDGITFEAVPGLSFKEYPAPTGAISFSPTAPVNARYIQLAATKLGADQYGNHYLQINEISATVTP